MSNNTNNTTSRLDRLLNNNKQQLAETVIVLQDTLTAVKGGFEELESDYNNEVAKSSRLQAIIDENSSSMDYELMSVDEIGKSILGRTFDGVSEGAGALKDTGVSLCRVITNAADDYRESNRITRNSRIETTVLKEVLKSDRIRSKISPEAQKRADELLRQAGIK